MTQKKLILYWNRQERHLCNFSYRRIDVILIL